MNNEPRITREGDTRFVLVFVNVITVLMVAVPVMDVINVVTVFNGFVPVTLEMGSLMILMDHFLRVEFAIMLVVDMAVMFDRFVSVSWEMFVVCCRVSFGHLGFLSRGINPSDAIDNDNRCQFF